MRITKDNIRELTEEEKWGFACNNHQCPNGADYGFISPNSGMSGLLDVLCENHAIERGWGDDNER
jgi:hypothetical protein